MLGENAGDRLPAEILSEDKLALPDACVELSFMFKVVLFTPTLYEFSFISYNSVVLASTLVVPAFNALNFTVHDKVLLPPEVRLTFKTPLPPYATVEHESYCKADESYRICADAVPNCEPLYVNVTETVSPLLYGPPPDNDALTEAPNAMLTDTAHKTINKI